VKALVINCSRETTRANRDRTFYNLGAAKLSDWLKSEGWEVDERAGDPGLFASGYDLVALSVIFSWHAPVARDIALRVRGESEVWCGGPGMSALGKWWARETGLEATIGLDPRFELQRGDYRMTFASRGCPVNCWFCIVPKIEGTEFTLDHDFQPAPILCDNNLSGLPVEFQEHIIRRYQETDTRLGDANSGFEPRSFDRGTRERWEPILKGPWRFAFDEMTEKQFVEPMMQLLSDISPKRKRVYVLIGNEPIESCYERAEKVREWGGEPYCQPVLNLNTLTDTPRVRHDWTVDKLRAFARYYNRFLWKYTDLWSYSNRKWQEPVFSNLKKGATA